MTEPFMTKDDIYAPRTERFTAVISRRQKTKSGKPRFYLYTMDNQNLIVCAEYYYNSFINFRISQTTSSFEPESQDYLGKIEHSDLSSKYAIFKQKESEEKVKVAETSFDINKVKFSVHADHERQMNISLFGSGEEPKPLERHPFAEIKEIYPDLEIIQSKQNI
ncbi:hypothetical protein TVAG_160990 [Trichomonas vaginalis G3]|uniref:Tubby C-terminal domain-containing protein n=1 Tax=Trichomonas vaginalis (strain ATCC PRA-98 / G3) TaxID=412133 RepID=A2E4V4_TRIV3|nr:tubby, C-terminal family [Trichomonas vaginalis G3]EAY12293.1 hypothetical protein TVAG_160990 [Trichomonas vaginalis G3]KAI5552407.1 tubby, C-terminal family [Trichomonas vaginalis G3]|eukprot:XP_001324516.1 hypothetical protein [Trichomonas vaginalis G3]